MEYPLWEHTEIRNEVRKVLILLLMEYPLWENLLSSLRSSQTCLNPSFNGIPARGETIERKMQRMMS
mgnify:CR=1 FL=1